MTAKPEEILLRNIIDLCKHLRLKTAHFRPALARSGKWMTAVQGDGKGWPDLTIVGPGGVMFRELKADGKYPTPEQRTWLADLTTAGANAGVWRPKDWPARIQTELESISKPATT